jgi:hypothetical protein
MSGIGFEWFMTSLSMRLIVVRYLFCDIFLRCSMGQKHGFLDPLGLLFALVEVLHRFCIESANFWSPCRVRLCQTSTIVLIKGPRVQGIFFTNILCDIELGATIFRRRALQFRRQFSMDTGDINLVSGEQVQSKQPSTNGPAVKVVTTARKAECNLNYRLQ